MNTIIKHLKAYLKVALLMLVGLALFDSKVESNYLILTITTYCIIKFIGVIIILSSINYLPFLDKPLFDFNITYKSKSDK